MAVKGAKVLKARDLDGTLWAIVPTESTAYGDPQYLVGTTAIVAVVDDARMYCQECGRQHSTYHPSACNHMWALKKAGVFTRVY